MSIADESLKNTGPTLSDMPTFETFGMWSQLICYVEDSLASRQVLPANGTDSQTNDGYGLNMRGSFACYDRDTASWKTRQACFLSGWEMFLGSWPPAGMTRNGESFPLPIWELRTCGGGSGLLPTIQASEGGYNRSDSPNAKIRPTLTMMARKNLWPTPTARDWKAPGTPERLERAQQESSRGQPLTEIAGGQLNPTWVEWLMGFPLGWTDLNPSETP